MRAGQELSCFKLKKVQSSSYFRTSYGKIFETVVEHLSRLSFIKFIKVFIHCF